MKILFLDIDGVVNNTASTLVKIGRTHQTDIQRTAIKSLNGEFNLPYLVKYTIESIDPIAVALVNRLLEKDSNVRIVMSSSHRALFFGSKYNNIGYGSETHLDVLRIYMKALGFIGKPLQLIHDVTPRLYKERGAEVKNWLESNAHYDITHHVAIDDAADFSPSDCNFVKTDASTGLTSKEYFEISKYLVIKESTIIF